MEALVELSETIALLRAQATMILFPPPPIPR
jgi:hypothetical protein